MEERPSEERKIFKIEQVAPLNESQRIEAQEIAEGEIAPSKTKFDSALAKAENIVGQNVAPVAKEEGRKFLSPIHELGVDNKNVQRIGPATRDTVLERVTSAKESFVKPINTLQEHINKYPNLKLSPADESSLSKKLIHADATLRSTLNIAGVEATSVAIEPETKKPLAKFLAYLTHGDKQMKSLEIELGTMDAMKLTPGKLISMQIKLSFIQREIEFFSNAMNKALEAAKTIMNVQV